MAEQDTSARGAGGEEETEVEKAARQEAEDEAELCNLRAKYGNRIAVFKDDELPGGRLVISVQGKRKQYQSLFNALADDKQDSAVAQEQFARECTVEPTDRAQVKQIFEDFPALASRAAGEAIRLAGGRVRKLGKD